MGLAQVLRDLGRGSDPRLLVGTETADDAGVFLLREGLALVQTVDFFPPLVDNPYQYGQIAAANSLSDVYAMNGEPLTVLNIVGFPDDELPLEVLGEILKGAAERVETAGAVTLGGHSVRDAEVKFGLSVTGTLDPRDLLTNAGSRPGDLLVLTKPLGTGFVTTAAKFRKCPPEVLERAIASMIELNAVGRDSLRAAGGASACTDVTGFGLAGHAFEMAEGAGVTIELDLKTLPLIEGSEPLAVSSFFTRASQTNRAFVAGKARIGEGVDVKRLEYAFDAQTSGGLLIAVAEERVSALLAELQKRKAGAAVVVGRVRERTSQDAIVLF